MSKVVNRFKFLENVSVCMLLIDLVIAFFVFTNASLSVKVDCVIFGALLIVHGLFSFIKYFYDGLGSRIFVNQVINGVVATILGLFLCFYKLNTIRIIGILVGIWFVFNGLLKIYHSIIFFKNKEDIGPLVMFSSILIVAMGVIAIFNPFNAYISVIKLLSIFFFGYAVIEGMLCFLYKRRGKNILSLFR